MIPTQSSLASLALRVRAARVAVYGAGELVGRTGIRTPTWPAGLTQPAGDVLRDLVIREGARRTLEVGTGLGLSSLATVEGLCAVGVRDGCTAEHLTIDPTPQWCDHAGVELLHTSGAASITRFMQEESALALPRLLGEGQTFDFAFIDGVHQFDGVLVDLFFALRLVKQGGLIVMDDHWMPSVQAVLAFGVTNLGLKLELFDPNGPGKRLVALRPNANAAQRSWDHFVDFTRRDLPPYPWRGLAAADPSIARA